MEKSLQNRSKKVPKRAHSDPEEIKTKIENAVLKLLKNKSKKAFKIADPHAELHSRPIPPKWAPKGSPGAPKWPLTPLLAPSSQKSPKELRKWPPRSPQSHFGAPGCSKRAQKGQKGAQKGAQNEAKKGSITQYTNLFAFHPIKILLQSNQNQLVSQSIYQSVTQSVNQSITQSLNQSVSQWVNQSVSQSFNQTVSQSINQLVS